jgi:UDP-3-O-[3-hydroxymyristoyl] glucosamine N-acyltransferase
MKLNKKLTLQEVAAFLDVPYVGNPEAVIAGINVVHKVKTGELTFVDFSKYYTRALQSDATFILIDKEVECPAGKNLLISADPFRDFNRLTQWFMPFEPACNTISPTAEIGEGTILQPGVFVGNHVKIGKNCIIHANVSICDHTEIGDNVVINPNSVIGGDAFFFKKRQNGHMSWDKLFSIGKVVIEDDVEIGSSCTIDRSATDQTIIGKGTKLDNMVHVGHGTVIGKNCLIAAQCGIAGKTILEDEVILWGQVGVNKELILRKGSVVLAKSGVSKDTEPGKIYFGAPAEEARKYWRDWAMMKRLPDLFDQLYKLNILKSKKEKELMEEESPL